jgi:5-methylcytosine-specific restriction endonuclease McrA
MRKLDKPPHPPGDVFLTCISRVRNESLKTRLEAVKPYIVAAASAFDTAASNVQLHTVPTHANVGGLVRVTRDEMVAVYDNRMVPKDSPGRHIYDEIITAPAQGLCPLCGQRDVSTLDHYLPKTLFPALAVVPVNLVPSCSECNKVKLNVVPKTQGEQTFHPYYDDVETDRWLEATVIERRPTALVFEVRPPASWDTIKSSRAVTHFNVFKLSRLYASQAATQLLDIRHFLISLHRDAGTEGVRRHLHEMSISCEMVSLNSWQSATYRALSSSQWYCEGGFD